VSHKTPRTTDGASPPPVGTQSARRPPAISECRQTPFLLGLMLPVWVDTPWNSVAITSHGNVSTLIQIPAGHMRFVPSRK